MGMFYSVDPGKKQSAVACFKNGELIAAYFAHQTSIKLTDEKLRGEVVMEVPVVYPGSDTNPNDLVDITAAGMGVAAQLSLPLTRIRQVKPAEWKGQVPKKITQQRIERLLTQAERIRLGQCLSPVKSGLRHNLWDAVGIGLFALKRAKRGLA